MQCSSQRACANGMLTVRFRACVCSWGQRAPRRDALTPCGARHAADAAPRRAPTRAPTRGASAALARSRPLARR